MGEFKFGDLVAVSIADADELEEFELNYLLNHERTSLVFLRYEQNVRNALVMAPDLTKLHLPVGCLLWMPRAEEKETEESREYMERQEVQKIVEEAVESFAAGTEKELNLFAQAREQQASFYADKGMERLTEQYLHDSFLYRLLAERIVRWAKEGFDGHNETGKG